MDLLEEIPKSWGDLDFSRKDFGGFGNKHSGRSVAEVVESQSSVIRNLRFCRRFA